MYPEDGREILRKVKIRQYQQAELRLRLFSCFNEASRKTAPPLQFEERAGRLQTTCRDGRIEAVRARKKSGMLANYVHGWKG